MRTAAIALLVLLAGFGVFVIGGVACDRHIRGWSRMAALMVAALAFAVVLGVVAF